MNPSDSSVNTEPSSPRKRGGAPLGNKHALQHGAPRGNTNALKHGLYSYWYSRLENDLLNQDDPDDLKTEEKTLKVIIARIYASMHEEKLDHDRLVVAGRIVALCVGRIESLHRTRKILYADGQATLEQALAELDFIPVEED